MKKFFLILLFLIMTALMIWCAGLLWFTTGTNIDPASDKIAKADAIIVLTGGQGRIEQGFYLFSTDRAPNMFISGVNPDVSAETLKKRWDGAPLPDCCLDLGYAATNTWGNALESARWIKDHKIKTAFLVTSDYHMPRARLEFWFAAPDVEIYPHPVFTEKTERSSIDYFKLLVGEYHKTLITYIRLLIASKKPS